MRLLWTSKRIYTRDPEGDDYEVIQIGGERPETGYCGCSHCAAGYDCCGHYFCNYVRGYLFGLVLVAHYTRNV